MAAASTRLFNNSILATACQHQFVETARSLSMHYLVYVVIKILSIGLPDKKEAAPEKQGQLLQQGQHSCNVLKEQKLQQSHQKKTRET